MGNMFDWYPQPDEYIPTNRPKPKKKFQLDIMTGETASHTFEVPFDVEDEELGCEDIEIIYKLGTKVVLTRHWKILPSQIEVVQKQKGNWKYSVLTTHLSDEDTMLFHGTYLDAKVQIKFIMKDYTVQYSEIYPITVVDSLQGKATPHPSVNLGFGWTED